MKTLALIALSVTFLGTTACSTFEKQDWSLSSFGPPRPRNYHYSDLVAGNVRQQRYEHMDPVKKADWDKHSDDADIEVRIVEH